MGEKFHAVSGEQYCLVQKIHEECVVIVKQPVGSVNIRYTYVHPID